MKIFFAHSVHVKLTSPRAEQLRINFLLESWKTSSVAPPWVTCLRIHHWLIVIGKRRDGKSPAHSGNQTWDLLINSTMCTWATTTAQRLWWNVSSTILLLSPKRQKAGDLAGVATPLLMPIRHHEQWRSGNNCYMIKYTLLEKGRYSTLQSPERSGDA